MIKYFVLTFFIISVSCNDNVLTEELTHGSSCSFSNGEKGICTKVAECELVKKLIIANKRSELVICEFEGAEPLFCCKRSQKFTKAMCQNKTNGRNYIYDKLYNGNKAFIGKYPFQVTLGKKTFEGTLDFNCGGSLIADDVVITAAHCFIRRDNAATMVRLGRTSLDLTDEDDDSIAEDIDIETVKIHPNYSHRTKHNDIALLKLKRPANLENPTVETICLSTSDDNIPDNLTTIGYGKNDFTRGHSNWLLKGTVMKYPQDQCKNEFSSYRKEVIDSQFCAINVDGVDSCQGDSGSPAFYEKDGIFYQYGVTSYCAGCGSSFPAVYTKINHYLDWIEKEMMEFENK